MTDVTGISDVRSRLAAAWTAWNERIYDYTEAMDEGDPVWVELEGAFMAAKAVLPLQHPLHDALTLAVQAQWFVASEGHTQYSRPIAEVVNALLSSAEAISGSLGVANA